MVSAILAAIVVCSLVLFIDYLLQKRVRSRHWSGSIASAKQLIDNIQYYL
jgi:hypothetical protein